MFTVKWIVKTPHGELTRMFEAHEVAVAYRDKAPNSQSPWEVADRFVDQQLLIIDPYEFGPSGRSFDYGIVYVMNETGATVGKYVLNDVVIPDSQSLQTEILMSDRPAPATDPHPADAPPTPANNPAPTRPDQLPDRPTPPVGPASPSEPAHIIPGPLPH